MHFPASFKNISSPGACLREAASAKAGEGIKGRGKTDFPIFTLSPAYRQAGVE